MTGLIRIFIVDDHPLVRWGFRLMLQDEPDFQIVGEADSSAAALTSPALLISDIVLVDVRLPGPTGLDLLRQLRQQAPRVRAIVLTTYDEPDYVRTAFEAGAWAYVLKTADRADLVDTVRAVHDGERRVHPSLLNGVLAQLGELGRRDRRVRLGLSDDEIGLLEIVAQGLTTRDAAKRLGWSEATIERRLQEIMTKLGAANRVQAVAAAIRHGLI